MTNLEDALRYPIGRFERRVAPLTMAERTACIDTLAETPDIMRQLVGHLSDEALEVPYRPGGWTVRQVVHHVPDSHVHAYIRMKLAITEERPIIKPYAEEKWAQLADGCTAPVELSLNLLDALHRRWVIFLRSLSAEEYVRTYLHPEIGETSLSNTLASYAWHSRHHLAHIQQALRSRR